MKNLNYNGRRWRKIKSAKYGFIGESYYPKKRSESSVEVSQ
jgi:hypothetical protein